MYAAFERNRAPSHTDRLHADRPSSRFPCSFVLHIPGNLPLDGTAPLLCAGITVYSPLKHYNLDKPGLKIGVVGLGGLGHMVSAAPFPLTQVLIGC